ncbi:FR47-like protein [Kribbella voronezhensis]|uniref:FR47-like protein n=1 Tax=Kribbella voronezhensis TaxID=2512212 RepID=A0A4R7TBZ4_9ACTN|nr:GNAT family N-acetyltransferase [Kribbella voronezhensis]TDU89525.1 FR47-like protein [Kribbella voronezhensis]
MREVSTTAELARIAGADPMIVWCGQGELGGRVRAWSAGDAVAVASPELSMHDRLAVHGPVEDLAGLVAQVLSEDAGLRVFGDEALIRQLADRVPGLTFAAAFGWMHTTVAPSVVTTAAWLDADAGVEELLAEASPDSYAWPGRPGVRRWAGVTSETGELLSIAADAWSAPEIGFLAGVATKPSARGRGLSRQVCAFATAELVKRYGQAGLMVHNHNAAAISLYEKLGYKYRGVAAAHL